MKSELQLKIQAYLDGELSAWQSRRVARHHDLVFLPRLLLRILRDREICGPELSLLGIVVGAQVPLRPP